MEFKVFGCKTNKYFAEKWSKHPALSWAKGVFVSSCVVTDQAKRRWVRFVKQSIQHLQDDEKIYISGCGSIREGKIDDIFYETYAELKPFESQIVLLWEDPSDEEARKKLTAFEFSKKITQIKSTHFTHELYTRKHLVIQSGCDNHCTFCLSIQARGKHRWRKAEEIIDEIREYIDQGGKEVVLTGTNIGAWGSGNSRDFKQSQFITLLDEILEKTSIQRLRISSLWVEFLSDELLSRFTLPRIYAYIHLSIQSGSDRILKAMNRQYNRVFLLDRLEKIQTLHRDDGVMIQLWADLIVWFPGEEEQDFLETLELVEKYRISQLHAFPFSSHVAGYHVPAWIFPHQIPHITKHNRLQRLLAAWEWLKKWFLEVNEHQSFTLLLEGKPTKEKFSGWSENYIALHEWNFISDPESIFRQGEIIRGIFTLKKGWFE